MSGQHTQGRLEASGHIVRTADGKGAIADTPEDARRLAACWNACDGSTTEDLERLGSDFIAPWVKLFDELEAARALLAEALESGAIMETASETADRHERQMRIRAFLKGGA